MIEASGLSKRYGKTVAVDDLSFTVPPGQVTGFLGPNGAGKSTTMRLILGLDAPSSGSVTVSGRPYAALRRPLFEVAALLEARGVTVARQPGSALRITGATSDAVGELARVNGLTLQELSEHQTSLEDRYMELTSDSVDYRTAEGAPVPVPNPN